MKMAAGSLLPPDRSSLPAKFRYSSVWQAAFFSLQKKVILPYQATLIRAVMDILYQ
jgi:hypothetical protein